MVRICLGLVLAACPTKTLTSQRLRRRVLGKSMTGHSVHRRRPGARKGQSAPTGNLRPTSGKVLGSFTDQSPPRCTQHALWNHQRPRYMSTHLRNDSQGIRTSAAYPMSSHLTTVQLTFLTSHCLHGCFRGMWVAGRCERDATRAPLRYRHDYGLRRACASRRRRPYECVASFLSSPPLGSRNVASRAIMLGLRKGRDVSNKAHTYSRLDHLLLPDTGGSSETALAPFRLAHERESARMPRVHYNMGAVRRNGSQCGGRAQGI